MIIIKLLTFRTGATGISRDPVLRLVDFWNEGVIPVVIEVPQKYTGKYNLNIRQLHRISNKESLVKVNIFPYQAKL